jgi:mercuric ion binding protein
METSMKIITLVLLSVLWMPLAAWSADHEIVNVGVTGLACPFCAYSVEKSIGKLAGVDSVTVNLAANQVRVVMQAEHAADLELIKLAIINAGFTPGDVSATTAED